MRIPCHAYIQQDYNWDDLRTVTESYLVEEDKNAHKLADSDTEDGAAAMDHAYR